MQAIQLDRVTKQFDDVAALRGLDLTVEEGEIFGFLGPNGAGKSTTIDILLDFIRPTSGDVRVLGADPHTDSVEIRRRVGVLPDGYHVYDRLTGRQHVEFAIESKQATDDPEAILDRVGILDAADRKAGGYSKGMTQRLVLGTALVGDPELLILDEPSTGLDPGGAREMREIIREENERGATVFFSSHILEQVEAVCDRVGILRDGELVAEDTIEGLRRTVGPSTSLELSVDRIDDAALDRVRSLDGISRVRVVDEADGELVVDCDQASKTDVLDEFDAAGVTVRDFATKEASLEELFMSYTGERDREVTA